MVVRTSRRTTGLPVIAGRPVTVPRRGVVHLWRPTHALCEDLHAGDAGRRVQVLGLLAVPKERDDFSRAVVPATGVRDPECRAHGTACLSADRRPPPADEILSRRRPSGKCHFRGATLPPGHAGTRRAVRAYVLLRIHSTSPDHRLRSRRCGGADHSVCAWRDSWCLSYPSLAESPAQVPCDMPRTLVLAQLLARVSLSVAAAELNRDRAGNAEARERQAYADISTHYTQQAYGYRSRAALLLVRASQQQVGRWLASRNPAVRRFVIEQIHLRA